MLLYATKLPENWLMKRLWVAMAVFAAGLSTAHAEDILIGAIYPLSGNASQIGVDAQAAVGVMSDIINTDHAAIPMLLGKGGGLPHMHGAHIKVIFADHQNDPQKARAEAERLITQEHVVALIGSYTSATAATISQVAERYEVPYMAMDNSSPSLSQRGLKWFFRTSPHDEMFTQGMFDFYKAIGEKTGHPVKTVSLFYEDSIFGSDSSNVQKKLAAAAGIKVVADIKYRANSPSLSAEAQRLKSADADVVMPSSYTSDAILLMRSDNEIGYHPTIMAQSAGFAENSFLTSVGTLADGVMSRSSFALDAVKSRPAIPAVNAMFRARANKDLNDNTSRQIVAVQTLADAIDRAGSSKPEDIRAALTKTDIPGDQTIMPLKGVKFDSTGQNTEATPVIQQISGGAYHTIYPFDIAVQAPVWNVGK
ncbi:ABC transporter substrate-binding protein [Acidisphaera sp. L21]|uniref:ABC transporter substrate-binding protein n=1 Tax=Acidisphaera sp. L21 TaxID=1641851 RepID=UPI0020B128DF|nr:ABC transporter substrate-binding protein [Acidisphaera sp. L21]